MAAVHTAPQEAPAFFPRSIAAVFGMFITSVAVNHWIGLPAALPFFKENVELS